MRRADARRDGSQGRGHDGPAPRDRAGPARGGVAARAGARGRPARLQPAALSPEPGWRGRWGRLNMEIIEKIIVDKNPNGFFRGNGNYILVGETIIIPTVDDIRNYVFSYNNGNKFDHIPQEKWIRYPN